MGRWEPGADGRLRAAAMELYVEQGFEQTTVAQIAERAGVTSRTFFRHFADKREVIFGGSAELVGALVDALEAAPASATAMEAVWAALARSTEMLGGDHQHSSRRGTVIAANAELRERELTKMATLSTALAGGLRRRGVADPEASLAAEVGVAVFRVAFEEWVTGSGEPGLDVVMRTSFDRVRTITGAG